MELSSKSIKSENAFQSPAPLQTAVLLLVFNRPEVTALVFEAIRQARPPRLYVAADGPRSGRADEAEKCAEVRSIATAVDWPCKVHTLFREQNIGCRFAPQTAIDWFFDSEEEGIILEDDCLPHRDFFTFCEWALNAYREDKVVWHINGNNFDCAEALFEAKPVGFSALAQVWGWATWRDRWKSYQGNPFYLMESAQLAMSNWLLSPIARINKISHISNLQRGLDAWDYQWQVAILNQRGLTVSCASNLISNYGDGADATHTFLDNRVRLKMRSISTPMEYVQPSLSRRLTDWYENNMGLGNIRHAAKWLIKLQSKRLKASLRRFLSKILFRGLKPIVVAGTGRCGSTLLFQAISEGLVLHRFHLGTGSWLGRTVIGLSREHAERLSNVVSGFPVYKTHDLFDSKYANCAKYIFIHGDPLESAQSVELMVIKHGMIWFDEHLYNLSSQGNIGDLFEKDILGYENQMSSWLAGDRAVFSLKFEEIWERNDELSDYLGFEVNFPVRRSRVPKEGAEGYNIELFRRLRALA
jgi:hypothetical protein